MKILIDADACPKGVLAHSLRLGERYNVPVWTVANFHHQICSDHHITVDGDSQAADLKIANNACTGDIVVTQDWGLAALVLGRGAAAMQPGGRRYCVETIDFMLEERDIKARLRRSGGRTKGPKKRSGEADERFARELEALICEGLQANRC